MRARLITIGDELLLGQVVDTNAAWIGAYFAEQGIKLLGKVTVGDNLRDIVQALGDATKEADFVMLTGGLGPTSDDLTLECLASFLGVGLQLDEGSWQRIQFIFSDILRRPMTGNQQKQAMLPVGAMALPNQQGTAPGVWCEREGIIYIATPGVPREMQYLLKEQIVPRLLERFPPTLSQRLTIQTAGLGETEIATAIEDIERELPAFAKLAYLPSLGTVRLRINVVGEDAATMQSELDRLSASIVARLSPGSVFGYGDTDLVEVIHHLLQERNITMATAESCTGGEVASMITSQAGASAVYRGSIIAYDNEVKVARLGVASELLSQHGAVSKEVVMAMVKGACKQLDCGVAIATSGVAGPGGGSPDKPVGTVWIAAGNKQDVWTRQLHLGGDRSTNILRSSIAALDLLRRFLLNV